MALHTSLFDLNSIWDGKDNYSYGDKDDNNVDYEDEKDDDKDADLDHYDGESDVVRD